MAPTWNEMLATEWLYLFWYDPSLSITKIYLLDMAAGNFVRSATRTIWTQQAQQTVMDVKIKFSGMNFRSGGGGLSISLKQLSTGKVSIECMQNGEHQDLFISHVLRQTPLSKVVLYHYRTPTSFLSTLLSGWTHRLLYYYGHVIKVWANFLAALTM